MTKVLILSPVRQDPDILKQFLESLGTINSDGLELGFALYDDNNVQESSDMLNEFLDNTSHEAIRIPKLEFGEETNYDNHGWSINTVDRLITIKDTGLHLFKDSPYDSILLLDSDVCIHPDMLKHMVALPCPIVSEIYWTQFYKDETYLPNAWDIMPYSFASPDSISRLTKPGLFEVGGLGACTLISKEAVARGIRFERIYNLDFKGEDHHLCVRAACLGFHLFIDTLYPCFHIYRQEQIAECVEWKNTGCSRDFFNRWLDEKWHKEMTSQREDS
jgi:hypothetical protein